MDGGKLDQRKPKTVSLQEGYRVVPLSHEKGKIHALIGDGFEVLDILMPKLSCSIKPKADFDKIKVDHVEQILSGFDIKWIISYGGPFKYDNQQHWCKVTFLDECIMEEAIKKVNKDNDVGFTLVPCETEKRPGRPREFILRLRWVRRKGLGHCYVQLENPEDKDKLVGYKVKIGSANVVKVSESKGKSDLVIYNIESEFTNEEVIEALAKRLKICPQESAGRLRVTIPRKNVAYHSYEMDLVHKIVVTQVSNFVEMDKFTANVSEFDEHSIYCNAVVKFYDAKDCLTAANGLLRSEIRVGNDIAKVGVEFKSSVNIPEDIHAHVETDLDDYMRKINERFSSRTLHINELKSEGSFINILAPSQQKLAKMKIVLNRLICGQIIDISQETEAEVLFTETSKVKLQNIETETDTKILINDEARKITLRGSKENRKLAFHQIEAHLSEIVNASEDNIDLKGDTSPPGLLKTLLLKYGPELADLQTETGLTSIELNLKEHTIKICGDNSALQKAVEEIHRVAEEMASENSKEESDVENEETKCPVCLSPEAGSDNFIFQNCRHVYCKVCVVSLVQWCTNNHALPMKCMHASCDECIAVKDVEELSKAHLIDKAEVVQASARRFVRMNDSEYRFCVSPMCGMVYKVGVNFRCPECGIFVCTTCHVPYHSGVTCKLYSKVS